MKLTGKIVAVLLGTSLLGAMGFAAYLAFQTIVALFASLDSEVATVTGIACLVALTTAWGIARSLRAAVRQGKAMALREEKAATYQLFVDYWESRLGQGQARKDSPENLKMLDRLLALYAAPAVIRAHTRLRDLDRDGRHAEVRTGFGEALVAIRKDLGADTTRELARELERLLLPDPPVRATLAPNS